MAVSIADLYVKTNSPGRFFLIDTDDTYWASVEEYPKVAEAGIVENQTVYDWPGYTEAAKEFAAMFGSLEGKELATHPPNSGSMSGMITAGLKITR